MDVLIEVGFWGGQFVLVSLLLLGAYRLRPRLGLSAVVAAVVSLQFFQAVLGASFYWEVADDVLVTPGSAVLFASNLALLLYAFARDGIATARVILYAILIGNIVPHVLGALLWAHIEFSDPENFLGIPVQIFYQGVISALVGVAVLYVDQVLALVGFAWLRRQMPKLPVMVPMTVVLVVVLALDTVLYLTIVHFGDERLSSMIASGVVAKAAGGVAFGVVWGGYLQRRMLAKTDDVREILRFVFFRDDVEKLREAATRDSLTGLYNRRTFDRIIGELLDRNDSSLSLLLCDVDHFKQVNDTLGHAKGDEILVQIGTHLTDSTRQMDFTFRVGGDEFAILLPECVGDDVAEVVRRIKAFRFEDDELDRAVTISVGTAVFPDDGTTLEKLYKKADDRLYEQKGARCRRKSP